MEYCSNALPNNSLNEFNIKQLTVDNHQCDVNLICNNTEICAIREEGEGYIVKRFPNRCELHKHNCKTNIKYTETELFICESALIDKQINDIDNRGNQINDIDNRGNQINDIDNRESQINDIKNLVIINGGMLGTDNVNESIDSFFAATHVFDLPVKEMDPFNTRRRLIKNAGPVKIFVPLIMIPKEKKNDTYHRPTLSTCYHTCPTKCPDTYAPVCGVAGIMAREPALMFKNHCFMDVAQCKMFWENKSSTSHSSSYIESSFLFCMGDEMNALYRFLPAIRTLQRMGRLKKKGKFRLKMKNFRFISEFRSGRPNFMG
ncbi:uncharacterized protein LOC125048904 [Pieris napi]|uniref:uncharacterized protein LOC125048904 n=1 Tax=Pieris napi TaxID=78633 RepID=UPI001FBB62D5|nr:uncharacterized protein LOC125048904 [Pieris napi]